MDDKCCNCTPGYFNFSDQGCQGGRSNLNDRLREHSLHCIVPSACNCSALAVSEECDQVTGACICQDGAQGLKCDDCQYGYIGNSALNISNVPYNVQPKID